MVDGLADHDFTTDEEADDNRQEQGEEEGSESVRHARSEGVWRETEISVDQRVRDEVPLHRSAHIRGLDDTLQNCHWDFFFHFFPLAALDKALSMMQEAGQEKWRDFRLDRHLFSRESGTGPSWCRGSYTSLDIPRTSHRCMLCTGKVQCCGPIQQGLWSARDPARHLEDKEGTQEAVCSLYQLDRDQCRSLQAKDNAHPPWA